MSDRPRKPRRGRSGPGRKPPPPDETGRETAMYRTLVEDRTAVRLRTTDGRSVRGTVVGFDDDHLTLRSPDVPGTEVRLAFRSIRSIEVEGATR